MSSAKKDRKIQSYSGKEIPIQPTTMGATDFALAISSALHREFGDTHAAVKTVVALTRANERAVKNWFLAKNGPTGQHLVDLARNSEEVLQLVLTLAGRQDLVVAKKLADSKQMLIKMVELIKELQRL